MNPLRPQVEDLSPEDQRLLRQWLADFEQSWEPGALAERVHALPPAGALRYFALAEMVEIDLRRQWGRGRGALLESYLEAHPELGTAEDLPLRLIQAELRARRQAGDPVGWAEYTRRFPKQAEAFRRDVERAALPGPHGPRSPVAGAADRDSETLRRSTASREPQPTDPADSGTSWSDRPAEETSPSGSVGRVPVGPGQSRPRQFGRYELLEELGRGAMGTVYLARDAQLQRRVALKIPHFSGNDDPEAVARFHREARAVATLDHPNICHVYEVGEVGNVPYFTMAYVEGQSLNKYLRANGPLAEGQAVELVYRLALALAEAHALSVIHRDLKPSNILLNQRGEPVLMDFGLARRCNQDERLTQEGSALGTPAYMSPEQVRGQVEVMGPRCDIYSLGVVLYELLTGRVPFQGRATEVMLRCLMDEPPPPSTFKPKLNRRLEKVCLKAMAKDPAARYATMEDFAAALAEFREHITGSGSNPPPVPPRPKPDPRLRRRVLRLLAAAALAAVLLACVAGVWALVNRGGDGKDPPPPPDVAVHFHVKPPEAEISIAGEPWKPANVVFKLKPGHYQVDLRAPEHEPQRRELTVVASDQAQAVEYALTPLTPAWVLLTVRSTPQGAQVFIDGKPQGMANGDAFKVRRGRHDVQLKLPGFKTKVVEGVNADQPLEVTLERPVRFESQPAGARVQIDMMEPRETPAVIDVPAGNHTAKFSLEGYEERNKPFDVVAGLDVAPVRVELPEIPAQRYALLVGVNAAGPGIPDFSHAEADVVELGRVLVAAGWRKNVTVLTLSPGKAPRRQRPTAARVRQEVAGLVKRCTVKDTMIVALVGCQVEGPGGSVCFACPAARPDGNAELLPLGEVFDALGQCKAQTRLVLLDGWRPEWAAAAGPARPGRVYEERSGRLAVPPGVTVLCSCSAEGQTAYEHPQERHGLFCHFLIRGLQGYAAPAGQEDVKLDELVRYVQQQVSGLAKERYRDRQEPEWLGGAAPGGRVLVKLPPMFGEYRRGCDLLEQNNYAVAMAALEEAVRDAPQYVEAHTRLAQARLLAANQRRDEARLRARQALEACQAALELDPESATAHSLGGMLTSCWKSTARRSRATTGHVNSTRPTPAFTPTGARRTG
jgi:serine/threonine protein kinase